MGAVAAVLIATVSTSVVVVLNHFPVLEIEHGTAQYGRQHGSLSVGEVARSGVHTAVGHGHDLPGTGETSDGVWGGGGQVARLGALLDASGSVVEDLDSDSKCGRVRWLVNNADC